MFRNIERCVILKKMENKIAIKFKWSVHYVCVLQRRYVYRVYRRERRSRLVMLIHFNVLHKNAIEESVMRVTRNKTQPRGRFPDIRSKPLILGLRRTREEICPG